VTTTAPPVRTILVALDESLRAPLVIATASMMARGLAARLFPIRVLVIPPQIPPAAHTHPDGLEGLLEAEAREDLQRLMDAEPFVQFGTPIVVEGEPWRQILVAATDLDVDLIVVGSHRYHGLDRILGTTAAKVVNHADRNVLVVHARPEVANP
jgi:nucleotide-binding universal stress UspA family protein